MDIGPGQLLDVGRNGFVLFLQLMILVKPCEIHHDIIRMQRMILLNL